MLKLMRADGVLEPAPSGAGLNLTDVVWVDLLNPTREEELGVEAALGLEVPTREEMSEIEASSRLYKEKDATFMTAAVIARSGGEAPTAEPVTFILVGEHLVTLRYAEPTVFRTFAEQARRQPELVKDGAAAFLNLLEAVVDRTADVLERAAVEVEDLSSCIFTGDRSSSAFEGFLKRLGRVQNLGAKVRESLVSLARLLSYAELAPRIEQRQEAHDHLKSLARDVVSLTDHVTYLTGNVAFLLDAALGFINIQQNSIFKVLAVFSAVFMPPTLVGAIYGMNFQHMPELAWRYGYPFSLALMAGSALAPILWFRRKGWL